MLTIVSMYLCYCNCSSADPHVSHVRAVPVSLLLTLQLQGAGHLLAVLPTMGSSAMTCMHCSRPPASHVLMG